jgi:hypothetical protein
MKSGTDYDRAILAAESAAVATWEAAATVGDDNRLRTVLDEYRRTLEGLGLLTPPELFDRKQIDGFAWALAVRSDFPRYTQGDGWKRLTRSMVDVEHAATLAHTRLGRVGGSESALRDVDAARTALEAFIRANGDTDGEPT